MSQECNFLKPVALAVIGLALGWADRAAHSAERVQIESARYQVSSFQLRRARERGEKIAPPPADTIDGYLTKPDGAGPFAALVHLHGCGGLSKAFKDGTAKGEWLERLAGWGYVVLAVDSFTSRGIGHACTGSPAPRLADAFGALSYLARQPFVDANRIALIGFSQGGTTALAAVGQHEALFDNDGDHKFKAAIAFYPSCQSDGDMTAPTLILIGELDDWTRASACTTMMASRTGAGSPLRLIVYPGAHHNFDVTALQPGREFFGHHIEYNHLGAEAASREVQQFLSQQLGQ